MRCCGSWKAHDVRSALACCGGSQGTCFLWWKQVHLLAAFFVAEKEGLVFVGISVCVCLCRKESLLVKGVKVWVVMMMLCKLMMMVLPFLTSLTSGYVLCVYYCNIPFKFLQIRTQISSMQLMHNLGFVKTCCELHCKSFLESFLVVKFVLVVVTEFSHYWLQALVFLLQQQIRGLFLRFNLKSVFLVGSGHWIVATITIVLKS